MNEKEFLEWCKQEVCDYTNKHLDKSDNVKHCKIINHYLVQLYLMECIMSVHTMEIKKKCM